MTEKAVRSSKHHTIHCCCFGHQQRTVRVSTAHGTLYRFVNSNIFSNFKIVKWNVKLNFVSLLGIIVNLCDGVNSYYLAVVFTAFKINNISTCKSVGQRYYSTSYLLIYLVFLVFSWEYGKRLKTDVSYNSYAWWKCFAAVLWNYVIYQNSNNWLWIDFKYILPKNLAQSTSSWNLQMEGLYVSAQGRLWLLVNNVWE